MEAGASCAFVRMTTIQYHLQSLPQNPTFPPGIPRLHPALAPNPRCHRLPITNTKYKLTPNRLLIYRAMDPAIPPPKPA
jgi:hypothetical protein